MSNESGRQATARAEAMKVLSDVHGVPWNDTSGYLAVWFEGGHSYSQALEQILNGVLLPGQEPPAEPDLPGKPEEVVEIPAEVVKPRQTNSPKVPEIAKPKRPAPKKKP